MIRYVTTVFVLFMFALGAWAQNSPPHQHTDTAADVVDGSLHPELIPDSVAFRLYFIALAEEDATLTTASDHQKAFFFMAGLPNTDVEAAAGILRNFKSRLDALTDAYNTAVVSTNDSTNDRTLFVSKRETLVQATRDAFNAVLSNTGAAHFNAHVQREKQKMQVSAREVQQAVALRPKPSGRFRLAAMKSPSPQGSCYGYMDVHYNTYTTYATNSQGRNIYASTEVDGYTGEGNASYCYGTITHQPKLYLKVGTAGGWSYGQSVIPSSQIQFIENTTLLCDLCGIPVDVGHIDDVDCSYTGGAIYYVSASLHIEIAYTRAVSLGAQSNCYWNKNISQEVCDIAAKPWCTAATSPPDWPVNSVSSQVYPPPAPTWWEAFDVCLAYGSPGNLRPWVCGPTGFAVEMYTATPLLASCTYNP